MFRKVFSSWIGSRAAGTPGDPPAEEPLSAGSALGFVGAEAPDDAEAPDEELLEPAASSSPQTTPLPSQRARPGGESASPVPPRDSAVGGDEVSPQAGTALGFLGMVGAEAPDDELFEPGAASSPQMTPLRPQRAKPGGDLPSGSPVPPHERRTSNNSSSGVRTVPSGPCVEGASAGAPTDDEAMEFISREFGMLSPSKDADVLKSPPSKGGTTCQHSPLPWPGSTKRDQKRMKNSAVDADMDTDDITPSLNRKTSGLGAYPEPVSVVGCRRRTHDSSGYVASLFGGTPVGSGLADADVPRGIFGDSNDDTGISITGVKVESVDDSAYVDIMEGELLNSFGLNPAAAAAVGGGGWVKATTGGGWVKAGTAAGGGGSGSDTPELPEMFLFGINDNVVVPDVEQPFLAELRARHAMKRYDAELGYQRANHHALDEHSWIPTAVDETLVVGTRTFKLSRRLSVPLGGCPKIGQRLNYTLRESQAVFGPEQYGGILRRAFPMYNIEKSMFGRPLHDASNAVMEDLQYFYCAAEGHGCGVQIAICRCATGLLVYERLDRYNERCDHRNHDVRPTTKGRPKPHALSVAQKEVIVKLQGTAGGRAGIANELRTCATCTCTPEQLGNGDKFKKTISQFAWNNRTKYFRHQWNNEEMSTQHMNEILDSLKVSLQDHLQSPKEFQPWAGAVDAAGSDNYFLESKMYDTLGSKLFVIDHDYKGHKRKDGTYTLWSTRDIEEKAYKAASMYSTVEELERSIEFGDDWVELTKDLQCGHAGLYDRDQTYWPVCLITGQNENMDLSAIKMKIVRDVLVHVTKPNYVPRHPEWNDSYLKYRDDDTDSRLASHAVRTDPRGPTIICLCDGANALAGAASRNGMKKKTCYSHAARMADGTKRNSKRGTEGSLFRYLRNNVGLPHRRVAQASRIIYCS